MELVDLPLLKPKVVLGIAAHPDDLDVTAGGTMAAFAAQGAEVHYLILTDGSKGSDDPNLSSADLVKLREAEQRDAVAAVGGKDVHFLGYPDAELEITMQLKRDIVRVIRTVCPDVVVALDPSVLYSAGRGYINHPDHRAAGQAALDAVFPLARDHLTFPELAAEGCKPHKTKTILLTNFNEHNFVVDISDTFDKKMDAIKAHASQFDDPDGMRDWLLQMAEKLGAEAGYHLGEGFVRIDIR
ncbi:MAG TPA: PIG-L deacetylase family protein [Candidatus Saccharimonadales bacterium]|nr:PIG-L deacetylase family protein [Candidatus Saccharimonadales bacterium]